MTESVDDRSEAEWIGDIGWRALERLDDISQELGLLRNQFEMLANWAAHNDLGGTGTDLRMAATSVASVQGGFEAVRRVITATGREKTHGKK